MTTDRGIETVSETTMKARDDLKEAATATVEDIFADLRDRRFLKWLFDERGEECLIDTFKDGEELRGLDLDVQEEIKAAWAEIIAHAIAKERERPFRKGGNSSRSSRRTKS